MIYFLLGGIHLQTHENVHLNIVLYLNAIQYVHGILFIIVINAFYSFPFLSIFSNNCIDVYESILVNGSRHNVSIEILKRTHLLV